MDRDVASWGLRGGNDDGCWGVGEKQRWRRRGEKGRKKQNREAGWNEVEESCYGGGEGISVGSREGDESKENEKVEDTEERRLWGEGVENKIKKKERTMQAKG